MGFFWPFTFGVGTGVWLMNRYDSIKIKKTIEKYTQDQRFQELVEKIQKLENEIKKDQK